MLEECEAEFKTDLADKETWESFLKDDNYEKDAETALLRFFSKIIKEYIHAP